MITIIENPSYYTLPDNSFAFYFDVNSNTLASQPFSAPGTCVSPIYNLGVGDSEQECWDYIRSNNITLPEWIA